jgi:hypothetical protein
MGLWFAHFPLPILHEHGGQLEGAVWSSELAGHLARFHGLDGTREWFPWHVHWVQRSAFPTSDFPASHFPASHFPDGEHHGGPPADDDAVVQNPVVFQLTTQLVLRVVGHFDLASNTPCATLPASRDETTFSPRQFHEFRSSAPPLRALFSIARC